MPARVSLCLIARNEEANLAACLTSIADLVQEMIVVDTGSTDRTKEVAAGLGARVSDFPWVEDFAAARNESLRHATGNWVLWLDGDEHFDEENRANLRGLFAGLIAENAAYVLKQRSAPQHPGGSATVVDQVRLFRNRPEIRWRYRVHEQILPALRAAGHEVRFTDICLEHTGYQDPALLGHKTERNLRLLHLQEQEHPDDPFTLFNLGWVYQDLGQAARALPLLRRSLALSQPGDSIVRKLYLLVAQAHRNLGQYRAALAACRAGQAHCPDDPELLFLQAQLHRDQGNATDAERCLRQLLELPIGNHFASLDVGVRGVKARHQLAWVFWEQGRASEAEAAWRAALAEQPQFTPAWQGLGELFLTQARWVELEQAVTQLQTDPAFGLDATLLRARGQLARQELGPARNLLEGAVAQYPQALGPRVFLSHVLLQSLDLAAAERMLRSIVERDLQQAESWRNLAVLLRSQQRAAEALAVCQAGLAHCPVEPQLLRLHRVLLAESSPSEPKALPQTTPVENGLEDPEGNGCSTRLTERLRLVFVSFSPFAFTPATPYEQPLGGSESALCYLTEALAQQGHEVFLLTAHPVAARCRGVHCLPRSLASVRQLAAADALIVQNFAGKGRELRTFLPARTALVFWSQHAHDQPGVQALHDPAERQCYDRLVLISDWQSEQYRQQFGLDPEQTVILRNAISPAFAGLFAADTAILPQKHQPPVLVYTSTPFRGLDRLLDAFPRIRQAVPGVTLQVFSSMQVYRIPETAEQSQYGTLYRRCREIEGVTYRGSLPQPELAQALRSAAVLAYPNTFAETSCIAAMEALASGCRIVTSDLGALPETTAGFARLIPTDGDREAYVNRFVEATVQTLHELADTQPSKTDALLRQQVAYMNEHATWPVRAREWSQWLRGLRAADSAHPLAVCTAAAGARGPAASGE